MDKIIVTLFEPDIDFNSCNSIQKVYRNTTTVYKLQSTYELAKFNFDYLPVYERLFGKTI